MRKKIHRLKLYTSDCCSFFLEIRIFKFLHLKNGQINVLISWPGPNGIGNGQLGTPTGNSRKAQGKINIAGSTKIPDDELRTISVRELNRKDWLF